MSEALAYKQLELNEYEAEQNAYNFYTNPTNHTEEYKLTKEYKYFNLDPAGFGSKFSGARLQFHKQQKEQYNNSKELILSHLHPKGDNWSLEKLVSQEEYRLTHQYEHNFPFLHQNLILSGQKITNTNNNNNNNTTFTTDQLYAHVAGGTHDWNSILALTAPQTSPPPQQQQQQQQQQHNLAPNHPQQQPHPYHQQQSHPHHQQQFNAQQQQQQQQKSQQQQIFDFSNTNPFDLFDTFFPKNDEEENKSEEQTNVAMDELESTDEDGGGVRENITLEDMEQFDTSDGQNSSVTGVIPHRE